MLAFVFRASRVSVSVSVRVRGDGRGGLGLGGLIAIGAIATGLSGVRGMGSTPEEWARTAAAVAGTQVAGSGFAAVAGQEPTLGATSSAVRILKYCGGSIPDPLGAIAFFKACRDGESGGFAQRPGGAPDALTTASALMLLAELKIEPEGYVPGATGYLAANARSFEEVRLAVAGLEAVGAKVPAEAAARWRGVILEGRNADGTFGEGASKAFDTGGAFVALLRMGENPEDHAVEAVIRTLREGQGPDGGWGDGRSEGSTLGATYRIMRAFRMTNLAPDLEGVERFVASCRNGDGTYRPAPSGEGSGGTYFATILIRWCRELAGLPPILDPAGARPLFDGATLGGWEGDLNLWSAKDGKLTGRSEGLDRNEFLVSNEAFGDFAFRVDFRMRGGPESNGGIQFRSERVAGSREMIGYQADIGQGYWGSLYDESRRNRVLAKGSEAAVAGVKREGWNTYEIRAAGPEIRLTLNGIPSASYREDDGTLPATGRFGLQLHAGGPMTMEFRDMYIRELPTPVEAAGDSDPGPGFHTREFEAPDGKRRYGVYVPEREEGAKLPVILFLHGSGERGTDGVSPTQTGLGPAVLRARPKAVVVFPQARETWRGDSADAEAALAALDHVLGTIEGADRERVSLTGLSMGGAGTWSIAARNPGRFTRILALCGRGEPESARVFAEAKLPVGLIVGDDDRIETLRANRAMAAALAEAGAEHRYVEYRGVGHNCWDRAYNDSEWLAWLTAPAAAPAGEGEGR